jgi:transglutaminase-like putative cysteine protease
LYWRGPVLGHFNGRTWNAVTERSRWVALQIRADAASRVDYTVTLEPHQQEWLFALEMPAAREDTSLRVRMTQDAQVLAGQPITERVRYPMRSFTVFATGLNETPASLQDWLQLPEGFNPRTRRLADELRRDPAQGLEQQLQAVLEHFRSGGYAYTLEPPMLGRHSVETRQGYCEHYASAFVVLMRMLDIPARVVTGYQGGERNPVDGFLTVRQSDAHAWAEVWLPGRGWLRVDPTAVVAPLRINRGAQHLARQPGFGPIVLNVDDLSWLRALRFNFEALQNGWNQWVLSYSPERQRALLARLGFKPDWQTLGLLFAITLTLLMAVLAVFSLRHRVERDPLALLFGRFRRRLREAGVDAPATEGPRALATRLERELATDSLTKAREILQDFEQWRYSRFSVAVPPRELRRLRRAVQRFRPRAP